jgi:dTMP kinase
MLKFGKLKKTEKPKIMGKFIVIDGTDGSGKTTQTNLLLEELRVNGHEVETADFPQYGSKSAGMVEEYLSGKYGHVTPEAASIFYAVDRFDASFKIREWLNEGKIVISNRYVTANAGHQGGKIVEHAERVKFFRWLDNLEYGTFGIPKPDLNVILHIPAEKTVQLMDNRRKTADEKSVHKKKDLHEADLEHLKNAEKVYLEIAKLFPNTKLVECVKNGQLLTPAEIHNQVWELVRRIVLKGLNS